MQTINGGLGESIENVLRLLRKNFLIICCTTLIGMALGVAYVVKAPPIYTANAQIVILSRRVQIFQQHPVFGEEAGDVGSFESEMLVLQSKTIALSVVKKLNLANDPLFIKQSESVVDWLFDHLLPNPSSSTAPLSDLDRSEEAVGAIQRNLKIMRLGSSYVIDISFRSRNPERAAQIANAIADAYFASQADARYESMQQTAAWLQDRLGELREQQRTANRLVADFKTKNNLVKTNGQPIKEDELNLLTGQVIAARAHTSEALARLDRIKAVLQSGSSSLTMDRADPTVSDTLTNPIITKLREKYLDYANREADLSAKLGNNHLAVVNLRRQISELGVSMQQEMRRIAETYKSEYEIAKQRQEDLEKALAETMTQSGLDTRTQGPLQELQGSAAAYRTLYEGLLQRYVQSMQEQSAPAAEARVLTAAVLPNSPTGPKGMLIAAITSITGLMFGVGVGVFRQLTDQSFRTADQVEAALHTECISIVPVQNGSKRRASTSRLGADRTSIFRRRGVMWSITGAPFSTYAEAIRGVKFAVDSNGAAIASKVIGVTSSLPNEGKSTIAGSLALLAADTGAKVILVDCDVRNPKLSRELAPNAKVGLLNVVAGEKLIEQAILTDASTGLSLLPTGSWKHGTHCNELLNCEAARKLFDHLREKYEYIVVDLSPIAPIVDVRSTARFIDSYILVVEWGRTTINLAEHALKRATGINAKLLGVVLNKTPFGSLGKYQGYLKDYYNSKSFERYNNMVTGARM
jgi:succinoglycan biosynthesis transport protein ExoP